MITIEDLVVIALISLFFIGFLIKNIITARHFNQSIRGKSIKINLGIINSIVLGIVAFTSYKNYFLWIKILDFNVIKIFGLMMMTLACVLGFSTLITMKDSWRVGIIPEQNTDLIINDVFKISRNPYFQSFILLFFGIFLVYPTFVYLIFYLTFILILHLIVVEEEKHLTEQHGDSYKNYKNSVNRYFSIKLKKSKRQLIDK